MLAKDFVGKLNAFFEQLPRDFSYAVEIRNAEMLGPLYRDMLASHGVTHVYNHWSYTPALAGQHLKMESFAPLFAVLTCPCGEEVDAVAGQKTFFVSWWKRPPGHVQAGGVPE